MHRHSLMIALLVLGLGVALAPHPRSTSAQDATPATDCATTTAQENESIARRWHEEAINVGDLAVIDEIVTPDVVHHAGTFPDGVGPEAVKRVLGTLLVGFPDARHTVEDVVSGDDEVIIRWSATGTHSGEFQGYAPTGKQVTWTGINIFRFACGRIAEEWSEVDGLSRLRQLGVIATPAP
jgi:steroid delta-isomerase-like uncharacterized protein